VNDIYLGQAPPPRTRLAMRFAVFGLIMVVVVGVLTTRLMYLQLARGGYYAGVAQENRLLQQPLRSTRGLIYDRAGRPVAVNIPSYAVTITPADLPLPQRDAVIDRLATLLDMPAAQIGQALDRNAGRLFEPVRIAGDVPGDIARIIAEERRRLPGVEISDEYRRQYEYGSLLSHVLGYTGRVTADDLMRLGPVGYLHDDVIGKGGVEAAYEEALRGTYGTEVVERDGSGRIVRTVQVTRQPQPGDSIELSIDVEMQRQAEQAMQWAMDIVKLQRGVVIVMNPQTGEVLAMVSLPSYDNNLFARGISTADFESLLHDPRRPLLNFAISEQYPPGSTYKLVTGAAALAEGIINDRTTLDTFPYMELGPNRYYDWNRRGFGPLDIYGGFAHSSDTFFYQLAGRLGIDRLSDYAHDFGFGARTGIDLPAEARGIIPSNDWKKELFNEPIYPGEVYHAGIGQGYNATTPLQVLNAYAALANGGTLYRPQVVRRILGPDGSVVRDFEPQAIRQLDIDPKILRTMRQASREVVTSGHTGNLRDLPIVVAGKTGTAEFGTRNAAGVIPFHSWFVAFVPGFGPDQPGDPAKTDSELAIVAFAYEANARGNAATEVVKYFLQLHYDLDVDLRRPDLLSEPFWGGN
jgi:penicillin-binding protein 2